MQSYCMMIAQEPCVWSRRDYRDAAMQHACVMILRKVFAPKQMRACRPSWERFLVL